MCIYVTLVNHTYKYPDFLIALADTSAPNCRVVRINVSSAKR